MTTNAPPDRLDTLPYLRPVSLQCQGQGRALALGRERVELSWSVSGAGFDHRPAGQQAYQVRVLSRPELGGPAVWDSGRVESELRRVELPADLSREAYGRWWWTVRVWGEQGVASGWASPAALEIGPREAEDFAGPWVGPSENLKADPLPAMGRWIAPAEGDGPSGETSVIGRLELPDGYPRCFGMAWVAGREGVTVRLNGEAVPMEQSLSLDAAVGIPLPWDKLRKGVNEIALVGPAEALREGVAILAAVHEAATGWHYVSSDEAWRGGEGGAVQLISGPHKPPTPADNGPRRAVEMSRVFQLDRVPAHARVYVSGLGAYQLQINGRPVGDELLTPAWTDFDRVVEYSAHDVTDLLREGENELVATLGNGWWSSGMGWQSLARSARPDQALRLRLQLCIADGDEAFVPLMGSDEQWRWRPSRILRDTLYHGQMTDLHRDDEPWRAAVKVEDDFRPRLRPVVAEPIRVTQTLEAESIRRVADGWLYDFGQNHAGRPHLRMQLPAGATLKIRHCEELDEQGEPYYENYRTAAVTDTVVFGDEPVDFAPAFTYRGYRYAVLVGLPDGFEPTPEMLKSQVLHNDVRSASRFACSNERFNAIDRILRWGLRSNLHSVPTDCPQRDERLGWTGDVQLFARTSCWLADMHRFYRKWLEDLCAAQMDDGGMTHVAPYCTVLPLEAFPVWADVITVLPRVLQEFYGDEQVLRRTYEPMRRWVGWMQDRAKDGLLDVGGFGDWVSLEATPPEFCSAAYYAYSSRLLAEVAERLGDVEQAEQDRQRAREAAEAFHRHYFNAEFGRYEPDTQTAQALPLTLNLTPEPLRQQVADHLAELVRAKGEKPATGFVGTAMLLPTLSRFGHHELAGRVLDTDEFPSLGYMIDQGATTVWERWNSDKEGPDMNSRNHFCLGAMAQWMYEDLAGVAPVEASPGFARVVLSPRPIESVDWLEFDYESAYGSIRTRWEKRGEGLRYVVELPANVTAEVRAPAGLGGVHELSPGRHEIDWPAEVDARSPAPRGQGVLASR